MLAEEFELSFPPLMSLHLIEVWLIKEGLELGSTPRNATQTFLRPVDAQ